jgi:hypothetical protein
MTVTPAYTTDRTVPPAAPIEEFAAADKSLIDSPGP